ncbi:MAG TPA: PA2169 family four-helix-bundle protein [Polyangiales bacterium]|nr:PA2169 family four-helix-bundle protein [Polyangiales bacterium]
MAEAREQSVDVLNSFLRGEISAVETYRQALEKVERPQISTQLQDCMQSHKQRVTLLSDQIRALGGTPSTSSGVWGAFAKAVEASAKTFGEKAAIAALEEGEDHGRNDYRRDLEKLDATSRQVIESRVLPEQKRTHDAMSALKKTFS